MQVGDILHIRDEEAFPADLVPLSSANMGGSVYMETSNLDGYASPLTCTYLDSETGHKLRQTVPFGNVVNSPLSDPEELSSLVGTIKCPPPNINLDSFDASYHRGRTTIPLTEQNLLLRVRLSE